MKKILIANRGEIAIRIARTAKALGISTVMVYAPADQKSEHVRYGDESVCLPGSTLAETYLNVDALIRTAQRLGADGIHPGYGFLSERPHFVEACQKAGIRFIGPSAESMRIMGDKIEARKTVDRLGVPRVPGSPGAVSTVNEAKKYAQEAGYPVLLKAAAGGGGKGMRRVEDESEIESAFEGASREALTAFGDGALYVEKYIIEPHHVEIQVFGDGQGKAVHLGERECSIQRRHQKVWEESPSPILNLHTATREKMVECAVKIASAIQYAGAGTFEFIVDGAGRFYFLEMNTRLQVEHPVSEWVSGVDLVEWQIKLASGAWTLPQQSSIEFRGASVEVRIYAEDPRSFLPAPGVMGVIRQPNGPFLRWDSAYGTSGTVTPDYDPMIAKLSVWGQTRGQAIDRLRVALDELAIEPEKHGRYRVETSLGTNLDFLKRLVRCPDVIQGNTPTDLIPKNPALTAESLGNKAPELDLVHALALAVLESTRDQRQSPRRAQDYEAQIKSSLWKRKDPVSW